MNKIPTLQSENSGVEKSRIDLTKLQYIYEKNVRPTVEEYAQKNDIRPSELESRIKSLVSELSLTESRENRDDLFNSISRDTRDDALVRNAVSYLGYSMLGNEKSATQQENAPVPSA